MGWCLGNTILKEVPRGRGESVIWPGTALPVTQKAASSPHDNQVLGSVAEARPQNLEGNLRVLAFPVENSYKGQVVAAGKQRERKAPPGTGKILKSMVE